MKILLILPALILSSTVALAASDPLATQTLEITSSRSEDVLKRVAADPKAVFQRYQPALDKSSEIVRPVRISGSNQNPIMQVSIRKCMAMICKTVDLDASITVHETRGDCDLNYQMEADLSRSSQIVRDVYDRLDVEICYKANSNGTGKLVLKGSAHHAPKYSQGIVQGQMFKMLQMQVAPIVQALQETIKNKERK